VWLLSILVPEVPGWQSSSPIAAFSRLLATLWVTFLTEPVWCTCPAALK
jgi:hypothetical protein